MPGLRAGMPLGNKCSYIVTYVISSLMILEGQSHSFTRALTPVRRFLYPQPVWKYCYYSACPSYIHCPRYATHTTTYKIIPIWEYTPLNRKGIMMHKIRPHYKYPMLPSNKDLSVHSERIHHYQQQRTFGKCTLSAVKNRSPPKPVRLKSSNQTSNNLSLSKRVTLNSLNKISDNLSLPTMVTLNSSNKTNGNLSVTKIVTSNSSNRPSDINTPYQNQSSINITVSPEKSEINSNNNLESERRNYDNNSVLCSHDCQNAIDHVQNTGNTTVSPFSHSVPSIVKTNFGNLSSTLEASLNNTNEAHESIPSKRDILFQKFMKTLDRVERKFLLSVFNKLRTISPENRKENGISFLQSGLFLHQLLMSLSITMDQNVKREIEEYFGLKMTEDDKIEILQRTASWLPKSSDVLKFRWALRLVLRRGAGEGGGSATARGMPLQLAWLEANETSAHITETLNSMVLSDSGGSMHDTFSEEEVEAGVCAAALGTAYVRGAWRAAPTLLNGSLPFRDAPAVAAAAPDRSSRYFRLNDVMAYSYLHEWNAEAIEIPYAAPGLTLLILVPKEPSLGPLVARVAADGLRGIVMNTMRIAVTLPLYTLRMTLLLPNKLQEMGMPSLIANGTECSTVKLSHAVQRLMFWAEAGRNAFKDDGIEWDPRPELELVVDRPYLFFVRWQNITIMNGVFAL